MKLFKQEYCCNCARFLRYTVTDTKGTCHCFDKVIYFRKKACKNFELRLSAISTKKVLLLDENGNKNTYEFDDNKWSKKNG